ncbi:uncharacterized protein LOC106153502 [Lingula anatina]|uniref:Uncharacterized protein LOC106153502 n=1 Tax=Lingula anatina TaxID=7574 RepID=A0A1S3HA86_LINAN|nr:uncharacterized protein LOC106153502 [Lingula anatina]|eukprot:XP_013382923.1 uncharacterized protein LOC106153502 [Lingula anatina]
MYDSCLNMVSYQIIVAVAVLGSVLAVPPLPPHWPPKPAPSVYRYRWSVNGPRDAYFVLTEAQKDEICKECKPLGSGLGGFFAIEDDPIHYIRCVPLGDTWQVLVLHCCNNAHLGGGSTEWYQEDLTCVHSTHPNPYPCEDFDDSSWGSHTFPPLVNNPFWPLVWTPHLPSLVEDRDYPSPVARVYTGVYTFAGGHVQRGFRTNAIGNTVPAIEFDGQQVPYHDTAEDSYSHIEIPFFQNADWSQYLPGFTITLGFCVDPGSPPDAALITNADCNFTASVELTLRGGNTLEAMIRTQYLPENTVDLPLPARPSGCYFAGFSYTRATNQMLLWLDDNTSDIETASGPPRKINQNPLFFGYSCYGYPDTAPPRALDGALAAIHIWGDRAMTTAGMYFECVLAGFCV